MKKWMFSFLLIIVLFCNNSVEIQASNSTTEFAFDLFDSANNLLGEVTLTAPKIENIYRILFEQIGLFCNKDKWGEGKLFDYYAEYIEEKAVIDSVDNYNEYLQAHLTVKEDENGEYEYIADSEMMNNLYNFAIDTIEEETGFFVIPTLCANDIIASQFSDARLYNHLKSTVNSLTGNDVFFVCGGSMDDDRAWLLNIQYDDTYNYVFSSSYSVPVTDTTFEYNIGGYKDIKCIPYDANWTSMSGTYWNKLYDDGTVEETTSKVAYGNSPLRIFSIDSSTGIFNNWISCYTLDGRTLRLYKSLDDLKDYSVGQRPYYATSDFYNYDSTIDNSTTITQTEIDNSITYEDVYNYIINNYDNPDSLTEDELRDILNDYLGQGSGNDNGNGNNNGSDNSGSGGNGLSGFLSGLGSIGDAILSILGKLLEYVGKAVELLSGTVTKVLDIVPKNITNLFGAFFSFLPEECMTYIELSLALGVILAIVGAFKK